MPGYFTADATAPASRAIAVTPNDSGALENTRALYVGGAGAVVLTLYGMADGTSVTFSGVPAGTFMPVQAKRVWATGTVATGIIALY